MDTHSLTLLLDRIRQGDEEAESRLIDLVYPELRRIARLHMRKEAAGHTLQPTALVHEVYLRIFGAAPVRVLDRAHFFALAARQMRRILVDHARARQAAKRGGDAVKLPIDAGAADPASAGTEDVIAVDEAIEKLEQLDPRAAKIIELRFFAGLTEKETAQVMGVSLSTLRADWRFARAWLYDQLRSGRMNRG
jgi:RNA polymerase sigma factor (TIGR02999 family)